MTFNSIISFLKNIDSSLLLLINGWHNSFLDVIMHYASHKFFWIPLYLLFLYFVLKEFKRNAWLVLLFVGLTITLSDQVCLHFFKNVFLRYRPCHHLILQSKIHLVDDCGGLYGFVSSHAANAFALSFFLFSIFKEKYSWAKYLFFWAAFVSYSRIYLGQHYPSDVFVGALVGLGAAWLLTNLYFYTLIKIKHV